jgi:hypothetical protein
VIGVVTLPDALHLQIQEEALHYGVIPTVSLATHAGAQTVTGQQGAIGFAGILAATVRVNDKFRQAAVDV